MRCLFFRLKAACARDAFLSSLVLILALAPALPAIADPIHDAARKGDLAKVAAMLKQDPVLITAKDKMGKTPLHLAAENDRKDVAELLIASGADVNARDSNGGFTPLDMALSTFHYMEMVQLLLDKGADANATSDQGSTPLQETAMRGQKDAAALLIAKGANVNAVDQKGDSPLIWAMMMGHMDVARMLVDAKADVNAKNIQSVSPLFMAKRRGDEKMIELLRQHGAHE